MSKEWEITIRADTNDADYVMKITRVDKATLERIKPLVEAIKTFEPYEGEYKSYDGTIRMITHDHNWPDGECLRKDLGEKDIYEIYSKFDKKIIEDFRYLCPVSEYGLHTIESVEITQYVEKEKWL
ncbi:MAG: hypothetical protein PHY47_01165 [Lachnospiraceae bacterium]|nr:hypothetical protein [Lachnospiraceae bacterium]